MSVVAWRVPDLMRQLGIDSDQRVTGVKLSMDEQFIEFRIIPNKAVDKLIYTLVETNGRVNAI